MRNDPRLNLFNPIKQVKDSISNNPLFGGSSKGSSMKSSKCCNGSSGSNRASTTNFLQNDFSSQAPSRTGAFENLAFAGGGTVGKGLRDLASVSDNIRTSGRNGHGELALGNTASAVYRTLGIDSGSLFQSRSVNATIADAAIQEIDQVYNKVKQGRFDIGDITSSFSKIQNANNLLSSLQSSTGFAKNLSMGIGGGSQACGPSPFAMDLISYAPKYRFLFVVEFVYTNEFQTMTASGTGGIHHAFVVKTSTRPGVEFDYDDVNEYNYRTKVIKRVKYQPITMTFYDDDKNNAFQFYSTYLKAMSPIANLHMENASFNEAREMYEQNICDFGKKGTAHPSVSAPVTPCASSTGPIGSQPTTTNILKQVRLYHVYRQGRLMNIYNLYNPRITSMSLADLDMASSEGSDVTIEIDFDGMFLVPGYSVTGGGKYNLQSLTSGGRYPFGLTSGGAGEKDCNGFASGQQVLQASAGNSAPSAGGGGMFSPSGMPGGLGGFLGGMGAIGGQLSSISNTINNTLGTISNGIGMAVGGIVAPVGQLMSGVNQAMNFATGSLGQVVGMGLGTVNQVVGMGMGAINQSVGMLGQMAGSIINPAIGAVTSPLYGLTQPLNSIINQGTGMLAQGTGILNQGLGAISNAFSSPSFMGSSFVNVPGFNPSSFSVPGLSLNFNGITQTGGLIPPNLAMLNNAPIKLPTVSFTGSMPSIANNFGYQPGYSPTVAEKQMKQLGYSVLGIGI